MTEVLIYHLRQTKSDNSDGRFIQFYDILRDRVVAACPRANRYAGEKIHEDARLAEIRDATVNHVTELMFTDRQGYDKQLDIYEVVFDKAVRSAHITKLRKVNRRENANEEVEDPVTGEVRSVVEAALERYKKGGLTTEDDLDYRIYVRRAINALPADEREVIDLMLAEIPIETNKDGEPSMTELLGCVEKTVRNRRNRAFARSGKHWRWRSKMANRDDILNDFTIEEEMSPAILKAYLQRYPEYTQDLLALFNELSMSDLESAEASLPLETKAISAEALRVQHVRQSLFGSGVKEFARDLGLPRGFFTGLNTDIVHLASMPMGLLKALACLTSALMGPTRAN